MSVDVTFKPLGSTFQVGTAAVQRPEAGQPGPVTFRVRCLAAAYLSWGPKSTVVAQGAPALGAPVINTIGMNTNGLIHLELPPDSWFISNVLASFEITPGSGGAGGTS
jgi:hypothetical protein